MTTNDKAKEEVSGVTPKIIDALYHIKFRLITIPIVCIVLGLAIQAVTTERNVTMIKFKLGSIATPAQPNPVSLAESEQIQARIRQNSWGIRDDYPRSIILSTLVDGDVVTVTGTAKGAEQSKQYLAAIVQIEIDFQNGRLEKMKRAQSERMARLQRNLEKFKKQRDAKEAQIIRTENPIASLAIQQGIDQASVFIRNIEEELDTHDFLNASDLFVDSTKVILDPLIIASSGWYRPLIAGVFGLLIGLLFTVLIAIIAIVGEFSTDSKKE
jgi:hypothetical protein